MAPHVIAQLAVQRRTTPYMAHMTTPIRIDFVVLVGETRVDDLGQFVELQPGVGFPHTVVE